MLHWEIMTKTLNWIKMFSLTDLWVQKDIAILIHEWNLLGFSCYSFFSLFSFYLWLDALETWVHLASESEKDETKIFCSLHCVQVMMVWSQLFALYAYSSEPSSTIRNAAMMCFFPSPPPFPPPSPPPPPFFTHCHWCHLIDTTWPAVVTLPSFYLIPPMFWHFLLYQVSFPEIFEEFILNFFHKGKTRLLIKAIFPIKGLF